MIKTNSTLTTSATLTFLKTVLKPDQIEAKWGLHVSSKITVVFNFTIDKVFVFTGANLYCAITKDRTFYVPF